MNEEIPSKKFATVVLGSIPESYDNFLMSLNARNANDLEGKVRLPTVNSTCDVVLDLHKVFFVTKLTKNLLSVPEIALMGAEIGFDKDKCLVHKDGKEFVIGCLLHDKLYSVNTIEYAQVSTSDSTALPEIWFF